MQKARKGVPIHYLARQMLAENRQETMTQAIQSGGYSEQIIDLLRMAVLSLTNGLYCLNR